MVVFCKNAKVVFELQNSVNDKNNFFSYAYEQTGDKWELTFNEFVIQIVQTSDNFKDLSSFRKLINGTKSTFFIMLCSLIITLLLITVLVANKFEKKHLADKTKIVCTIMFLIFGVSFSFSLIELLANIKDIEYVFFNFPESPTYPT